MKVPIYYTSLSENDVLSVVGNNVDFILESIEESLLLRLNKEDVLFPDKISQIFNAQSQERINCMPATILSQNVSGLKWVSVFPPNPQRGAQNVSGIFILSELTTGFPKAVMEGGLLTSLRTAAIGAVASKYLAKTDVETIGFIGAGEEARMHMTLIKHVHPSIKRCFVSSRNPETEKAFIGALSTCFPDVDFISCEGNNSKAAKDADIIVTAISAQLPLLKAKDVKAGALYIHVGGWEDEFAVAHKADKIICDEWNAVKHRSQTLSRMYIAGDLKDENIYCDLNEIISKKRPARETEEEIIYFNSVGLSFIDIYLANEVYKRAMDLGLGQKVLLASSDTIDYSLFK